MSETICPHCGAAMKQWEHRLTPGLVDLLMKFTGAVKRNKKNDVYFQGDVSDNANDCSNFPKLRYFGLIAKVKDDDGNHIQGHWLLTRRGGAFMRGDEAVHRSIKTFRNKIVERNEEKVFIWEVRTDFSRGYFQREFEFTIAEGKVQASLL